MKRAIHNSTGLTVLYEYEGDGVRICKILGDIRRLEEPVIGLIESENRVVVGIVIDSERLPVVNPRRIFDYSEPEGCRVQSPDPE